MPAFLCLVWQCALIRLQLLPEKTRSGILTNFCLKEDGCTTFEGPAVSLPVLIVSFLVNYCVARYIGVLERQIWIGTCKKKDVLKFRSWFGKAESMP